MNLRKMTLEDGLKDRSITDLPILFKGTNLQCRLYAKNNGYSWVKNSKMLHGGYYRNSDGSICLMPE